MQSDPIDVETFVRNVEREFNGRLPGALQPATRFRDLADWTSLQALIVVAGFERDYGVTLSTKDFDRAVTLADLHAVVLQHLAR